MFEEEKEGEGRRRKLGISLQRVGACRIRLVAAFFCFSLHDEAITHRPADDTTQHRLPHSTPTRAWTCGIKQKERVCLLAPAPYGCCWCHRHHRRRRSSSKPFIITCFLPSNVKRWCDTTQKEEEKEKHTVSIWCNKSAHTFFAVVNDSELGTNRWRFINDITRLPGYICTCENAI